MTDRQRSRTCAHEMVSCVRARFDAHEMVSCVRFGGKEKGVRFGNPEPIEEKKKGSSMSHSNGKRRWFPRDLVFPPFFFIRLFFLAVLERTSYVTPSEDGNR